MLINFAKSALVIIDVQNDYFEGGKCELVNPLQALDNIEKALKSFRENSQTIIHVQHINSDNSINYFFPDTYGVKIHDRIAPIEGEFLVKKKDPNCFYQTDLKKLLQDNGITHLVICGMMTHMCIDTTVRAARYEGFTASLLYDACATKNLTINRVNIPADAVHNAYMAALSGRFSKVIYTESIESEVK